MAKKKISVREKREAEKRQKLEKIKAQNKLNAENTITAKEDKDFSSGTDKRQKSYAKAAGLKSAFAVGDDVYLTSFGKGNAANLEAKISSSYEVEKISSEPKLNVSYASDIDIRMDSRLLKSKKIIADNPTYNKGTDKKTSRQDMLGQKSFLEKEYFGSEFDDNIHIQVIHNILDIEKILAVHSNNAVFTINNILRIAETENDDFIGIGCLDSRNTYDQYYAPEKNFKGKDNIIKSINKSRKVFEDVLENPRLAYFGNAFYERENKIRNGMEIYHILALVGHMRQCCFHGINEDNLQWLYNFHTDKHNQEFLGTLNKLYSEMLDRVNKNFIETNVVNIDIANEVIKELTTEEIIERYYNFIVVKSHKNMGFSIKKLREKMFDIAEAVEFKSDEHASVRSKLYKLIDFYISCYYNRFPDRTEDIVSSLRLSLTDEEKEDIYIREAGYLWEKCKAGFRHILESVCDIEKYSDKDYQKYKNGKAEEFKKIFDINSIKVNDDTEYFTKLMYILTFFLDGKEINDLLTTLINKFDNIASLLDVMKEMNISCRFTEPFEIFGKSRKIVSDLNIVRNFARMQKLLPIAERVMYRDAIDILGMKSSMSEDDINKKLDEILSVDESGKKISNTDKGFRSFIASNVIRSSRFQYLVRYCNSKKIRNIAKNKSVIEFVLKQLPKTQIDRYYISCTGKDLFGIDRKIDYLRDLIGNIKFEDFEDVVQKDSKSTDEEKTKNQKYQAIISLYLTVMYLIVKNLVYINSRYVIGFHCLERDSFYYYKSDPKCYGDIKPNKIKHDYRIITKTLCEEGENSKSHYLARNKRLRECIKQDLENSYGLIFSLPKKMDAVSEYRKNICHLAVIRNANEYIGDIREVDSYFALYHYLMQKKIMKECNDDETVHEYFAKLAYHKTYVKDMVKALNVPFGYNIPRFKNLSIDVLFDRNKSVDKANENKGSVIE